MVLLNSVAQTSVPWLYLQQGVDQVTTFIRHCWRLNFQVGKLLRIAVAWFLQQTGVSYSIIKNITTTLPHFESQWIGSLQQFMADNGLYLQ